MRNILLSAFAMMFIVGIVVFYFKLASDSTQNSVSHPLEPQGLLSRGCGEDPALHPAWRCYWLTVGLDTQTPHTLPGAVYLSHTKPHYQDPLVFIGGGPGESGQSVEGALLFWQDWLASAGIERDFVILEPRGAGLSNPRLECDEYENLSKQLMLKSLTFAEEMQRVQAVLEACFQSLDREVNNLKQFNSLNNASDLQNFLSLLGYQRWNYLGVSYGTRVALVAALNQPQVNKLILDSTYPFHRGHLDQMPGIWASAIRDYLNNESPGVRAMFSQLLRRLKQQPLTVKSVDWTTDMPVEWVLNDQRFYALIFLALYSTELRESLLELAAYLLEVGDSTEHSMLEYFYNQIFDPSFSSLLYFATECNDNPLVSEEAFEKGLDAAGELRPLFESDWALDICRQSFFQPGQLPQMAVLANSALVAVGENDPITTVEPSKELMLNLPNGVLLELEGRGHSEFYASSCAKRLIPLFLKASESQAEQMLKMGCASDSE